MLLFTIFVLSLTWCQGSANFKILFGFYHHNSANYLILFGFCFDCCTFVAPSLVCWPLFWKTFCHQGNLIKVVPSFCECFWLDRTPLGRSTSWVQFSLCDATKGNSSWSLSLTSSWYVSGRSYASHSNSSSGLLASTVCSFLQDHSVSPLCRNEGVCHPATVGVWLMPCQCTNGKVL